MIADERLEELRAIFVKHGVVLAYLFGSQAEGRTSPMSDVDLAVLFSPQVPPSDRFRAQLALLGDCGHVFRRNDVDVVVLNEAPPLLAYEVVRNGKLLYEDPVTRPAAEFTARTFTRYADTLPLRRLQQRYLFERIERRRAERAREAKKA